MAILGDFKKFMKMSPDDDYNDNVDDMNMDDDGYGYENDYTNLEVVGDGAMDNYNGYHSADAITGMGVGGGYSQDMGSNIINFNQPDGQPQVVIETTTKLDDAFRYANLLKEGKTVIMNTDGITADVRKRVRDFLNGVAYASDATLKKISETSFVMTPHTVAIGDDGASIANEQLDTDSKETNGFF